MNAKNRKVLHYISEEGILILNGENITQKSPAGCKLFVGTVRYVQLLATLHRLSPMDWVEDAHAQCMVRSKQIFVLPKCLVGTREHWNLSSGPKYLAKAQDKAFWAPGTNQKLEGKLLPEPAATLGSDTASASGPQGCSSPR